MTTKVICRQASTNHVDSTQLLHCVKSYFDADLSQVTAAQVEDPGNSAQDGVVSGCSKDEATAHPLASILGYE